MNHRIVVGEKQCVSQLPKKKRARKPRVQIEIGSGLCFAWCARSIYSYPDAFALEIMLPMNYVSPAEVPDVTRSMRQRAPLLFEFKRVSILLQFSEWKGMHWEHLIDIGNGRISLFLYRSRSRFLQEAHWNPEETPRRWILPDRRRYPWQGRAMPKRKLSARIMED